MVTDIFAWTDCGVNIVSLWILTIIYCVKSSRICLHLAGSSRSDRGHVLHIDTGLVQFLFDFRICLQYNINLERQFEWQQLGICNIIYENRHFHFWPTKKELKAWASSQPNFVAHTLTHARIPYTVDVCAHTRLLEQEAIIIIPSATLYRPSTQTHTFSHVCDLNKCSHDNT